MTNPRKYPFTFLINNKNININSFTNNKLLDKINNIKNSKIIFIFSFILPFIFVFVSFSIYYIISNNFSLEHFYILAKISLLIFLLINISSIFTLNKYIKNIFISNSKKLNKISKYLESKKEKEYKNFKNYFKNINIDIYNVIIIKNIEDINNEFLLKVNNLNNTDEEKEEIFKNIFNERLHEINNKNNNLINKYVNKQKIESNNIQNNSTTEQKVLENKQKEGILYKDIIKDRVKIIKIND